MDLHFHISTGMMIVGTIAALLLATGIIGGPITQRMGEEAFLPIFLGSITAIAFVIYFFIGQF
jgi:uncharacterized protein YybS (DUF2232 family)